MQVREEGRHHNFQEKEFERKINNEIETLVKPVSIIFSCNLLKLSEVLHFLTWKISCSKGEQERKIINWTGIVAMLIGLYSIF